MKELTPIEILEKLDLFYNNAWNKLILFTTILLAVVGVIVPLIINWWQNRKLKLREEELKNEIKSFFNEKLKEFKENLSTSLEEKYETKLNQIRDYQNEISGRVKGAQFHLQANNQTDIKSKLDSLYWAARGYIKGKDYMNLNTVLDLIVINIPKMNLENLAELQAQEVDFQELIGRLDNVNSNNTHTRSIRKIKVELTKLERQAIHQ